MKPLNNSLTASVFSLGKGASPSAQTLLPPDALVIVIQDSDGAAAAPPPLQWHRCHRSPCESLPIIRLKAEKAYSKCSKVCIPIINVSG